MSNTSYDEVQVSMAARGEERLLYVQGITSKSATQLARHETDALSRMILDAIKRADVDVGGQACIKELDVVVNMLDKVSHSYDRYYLQTNVLSGTKRVLISFLRRQADDERINQQACADIYRTAHVVQVVRTRTPVAAFREIAPCAH